MLVAALRPTATAAGCTSLAAGTKALALCDLFVFDEKGRREGREGGFELRKEAKQHGRMEWKQKGDRFSHRGFGMYPSSPSLSLLTPCLLDM
jgi:hypothetical protein